MTIVLRTIVCLLVAVAVFPACRTPAPTEPTEMGYTQAEARDVELHIRQFKFDWLSPAEAKALADQGLVFRTPCAPIDLRWDGSRYSLTYMPSNTPICRSVYYIKTFGGIGPTLTVYLINDRFVAYLGG